MTPQYRLGAQTKEWPGLKRVCFQNIEQSNAIPDRYWDYQSNLSVPLH